MRIRAETWPRGLQSDLSNRAGGEGKARARGWHSATGLALALLIIVAWTAMHASAIFFFRPLDNLALVPVVIAVQCWLYVGLFIIAHDCMHGSLVPLYPRLNRVIGSVVLFLYAGFQFTKLNDKHHAHHRHAGDRDDPDFHDRQPHSFWRWYAKFFTEYLTWRQPVVIGGAITVYAMALSVPVVNLILFWAVPALLSSLQLFFFGTYLPHRPSGEGFQDRHNARTNDYPWLVSLFTCFHFGYHHEHHLKPGAPWWKLPAVRASGIARESQGASLRQRQ